MKKESKNIDDTYVAFYNARQQAETAQKAAAAVYSTVKKTIRECNITLNRAVAARKAKEKAVKEYDAVKKTAETAWEDVRKSAIEFAISAAKAPPTGANWDAYKRLRFGVK